ncbi:MAG: hypothetical protein U0353_19660 [Sandaracinus sp.]
MAIETASSAALQCQGCGAPLEASRVDVKTGLASCASCNRVFKLAGETALVALPPRPAPRVIPDAFDTPTATSAPSDGYRGSRGRAEHTWRYRWFKWVGPFLVLFGLFFAGIAMTFVVGAIAGGGLWGLLSLLIPHLWVGLAVSYGGLATTLNRTTISLDARSISARTGPMPWRNVSLARDEAVSADHQASWGQRGQTFQVRIVGKDHRATKLLGGLTEEEARYLADELNDALSRDDL